MTPSKRSIWLFVAATAAVVAALVCAFAKPDGFGGTATQPGRQVTFLMPEKIPSDAVFFFWYGCPHCRAVEDIFAKSDADAQFKQALDGKDGLTMVPVPINQVWELHARLYYALSHVGVSSATHCLMMATIQDNGLVTKESMKQAIAVAFSAEKKAGRPIDSTEQAVFADLDSDQTSRQIEAAQSLVKQIGLKGVPTLLLKKSTVLELGNGVTYQSLLPTALQILKGGKHDE